MTALRPTSELTGATVTEAQAKLWFSDLRDYLNGLLGTDGTVASAQTILGIGQATATNTTFTPTGNIAATNVQAALAELDTEKASTGDLAGFAQLVSPAFSGTPTAPTATAGDNSTKLATTAFVQANAGAFPTGTRLGFQQTNAPTGWTKDTTAALNDSIMRIVTGTVSSGGTTEFSTFNAQTATGATTLSTSQIPSHSHTYSTRVSGGNADYVGAIGSGTKPGSGSTGSTGGGDSHTHSLTYAIKYYDWIVASKN